jgi:5-methyltetrahydrofolate--homocysteine methyltransferase
VHVLDASRSVTVANSLLSETQRDGFVREVASDYAEARRRHAEREAAPRQTPIAAARRNAFKPDWRGYRPPRPTFLGLRTLAGYDLADLVPRIDWTPFFRTWELAGKYPDILRDNVVGEAARNLFEDAQKMLAAIVGEKWLEARGVVGLFPANAVEDDIEVYTDESRAAVRTRFHFLRQQTVRADGRPNYCLADFVAPKGMAADYVGGFAVTAGLGIERQLDRFKAEHDDYSDIMLKALADRLAEAFAERLHERVRREFWGYARDERFDNEALIVEAYRGIRPAPGYPACPDHSEKVALFDLLEAPERAKVTLTESFAMWPASSVSGFYFAHPEARYFGVARIGRDQVEDYARRRGVSVAQAERWLAANLAYER